MMWKFLALTFVLAVSAVDLNQRRVSTSSGVYEAKRNGSAGVLEFSGIRFGEPPARFEKSVMASRRRDVGVLPSESPYACIQAYSPRINATRFANQSEDCLFLNVYVPVNNTSELRAVMVFIHGGGFSFGYSYEFDGSVISQRGDVIVVTINYRLGPLGFLTDYGTSVNEKIPANLGLWDQKLALEWVQQNIANFGGNPDRVTIFGESAGSSSVNYHLMSPLSQNLFRNAILESGTTSPSWAFDSKPSDNFHKVCAMVNCTRNSPAECVECLKKLNSSAFIDLAPLSAPGMEYPPVKDGIFVTETPREFLHKIQSDSLDPYRNYSLSKKSFILGYNSQESLLFWVLNRTYVDFSNTAYEQVGRYIDDSSTKDRIHSAMEVFYGSKYNLHNSIQKELAGIRAHSDFIFGAPTLAMARALSKVSNSTYTYLLDYPFLNRRWPAYPANVSLPPWVMTGSAHADELYFVFGAPFNNTIKYSSAQPSEYTYIDRALSSLFIESWTNLAKFGDPSGKGHSDYNWDKFNTTVRNTLIFNASLPLKQTPGFMTDMDNFWNNEIPSVMWQLEQTLNASVDQGIQNIGSVPASWELYTCRCGAAIVNPVLGSSETQQMDNVIANRVVKAASCMMAEPTCYSYCSSKGVPLNYKVPGDGSYFEVHGITRKPMSAGWKLFGGFPTENYSTLGDVMCSLYNLILDQSLGASLALKGDVAECPGSLKGIFVLDQHFCCAYSGSFLIGKVKQTDC